MTDPTRLFEIPHHQLQHHPQDNMFVSKIDEKWIGVSTKDFLDEAMQVSRALIAKGIQPGDRVGIVSSTRYEWNVMDIAIQQVGAIVVPFYQNISVNDYRYIFNDAGIKLCVVGDDDLYQKINGIK